ncbi:MAG: AmmeMemoRadiSam system protein A [Planctomycetes bacterium]|nr:AmmeMemoRadiSam system protein A [Planctomycetota bacterium]
MLSPEDRATLLDLARRTVAAAASGLDLPTLRNPDGPLREKGAVFVTLKIGGELRGCIGHLEAHMPLWESVRDMAAAAAERDTRFSPLGPDEVPRLSYEISVLSPMVPIRPDQIVVGTHGLYVKHEGVASGLLLPQVAVEWGWTPEEFLRRTFDKAGLPPGDPAARIFGFTVEHFSG